MKNWDKICQDLSSGDESDAGDVPNVQSVVKHAKRVAEMVGTFVGIGEESAQAFKGTNRSFTAPKPPPAKAPAGS